MMVMIAILGSISIGEPALESFGRAYREGHGQGVKADARKRIAFRAETLELAKKFPEGPWRTFWLFGREIEEGGDGKSFTDHGLKVFIEKTDPNFLTPLDGDQIRALSRLAHRKHRAEFFVALMPYHKK
jgi:hypothetical protein